MKKLEIQSFKPALRLARRKMRVYLENDKRPSYIWSNYSNSRDMPIPIMKMPKVGHFSIPKIDQ
jgi:hypothetical protein